MRKLLPRKRVVGKVWCNLHNNSTDEPIAMKVSALESLFRKLQFTFFKLEPNLTYSNPT